MLDVMVLANCVHAGNWKETCLLVFLHDGNYVLGDRAANSAVVILIKKVETKPAREIEEKKAQQKECDRIRFNNKFSTSAVQLYISDSTGFSVCCETVGCKRRVKLHNSRNFLLCKFICSRFRREWALVRGRKSIPPSSST